MVLRIIRIVSTLYINFTIPVGQSFAGGLVSLGQRGQLQTEVRLHALNGRQHLVHSEEG